MDDKRLRELKVRLTDKEFADLSQIADQQGHTTSGFAHHVLHTFLYGHCAKSDKKSEGPESD